MVTFICASRMTLPPFQYSRGGLMTRPLRETLVEDKGSGKWLFARGGMRVKIYYFNAARDSDVQVKDIRSTDL